LRPAWNRGNSKGFQPPPQVEQQSSSSRNKNASSSNDQEHSRHTNPSNNASQRDNYNKFSALDIDDDDVVIATTTSGASTLTNTASNAADASKSTTATSTNATETSAASVATNSRSEALRNAGRSLADLAARAPPAAERGRFSNLRTSSVGSSTEAVELKPPEEKVIRYTRERLLSMRPTPLPAPREDLKFEMEGSSILSEVAQDPVCWDNFDAEKIWATVTSRRLLKDDTNPPGLGAGGIIPGGGVRRSSSTNAGTASLRREASVGGNTAAGRWQRGVALPPEGSTLGIGGTKTHRSNRETGGNNYHNRDAENPNDLWDDPAVSGDGALMDFSAFGDTGGGDADGAFDFDKMAEASKKLEDDMRGARSRTSSNATNDDDDGDLVPSKTVNPNRPLATVGTTIRSGSGDHVNVFEDFDVPGAVTEDVSGATKGNEDPLSTPTEVPTIKAANEDPTASSRLMAMIGVKKDESVAQDASLMAWGDAAPTSSAALKGAEATARVSLNPWGDPVLSGTVSSVGAIPTSGLGAPGASSAGNNDLHRHNLDLQARMRQAELEKQKIEETRRLQQQEQERLRVLQQQEQERARVLQQQQQAGVQSRVELVLMERISDILEKSWGRSDLMTILSTLHAEDQRVMPLLNNIDSLRALLMRHPRRFAIRQDPTTRMEVVALLITNTQWLAQQQQQDALHQQQALVLQQQQEERQRLEQQRRMDEQQAAMARAQQQQQQQQQIVPDAPWYYSDPSKNIQGPFRGDEMRQWLEAGYFKGDLPISQSPNGPFRPLATIFKDLSTAFMNPNSKDVREELQRLENTERARAEAEALERERHRAEQQRKEKGAAAAAAAAAEQQRLQQARAEAEALAKAEKMKNANGGNESSAQLKFMLGLRGAPPEVPQQSSRTAMDKVTRPLDQRHVLDEEIPQRPPALDSPSLGPAKATAPAWGGAAVSQPVTKKSMSEIQKEEARAAAVAAMNRSTKPSSSGWANIAAAKSGTTAWSGTAPKPQPTAILSTANAAARRTGPTRSTSLQPSSVSAATAAAVASSVVPGQVQRSNSVATHDQSASVDAFGATMDPVLEQWCKEQMTKLNGTDDLTLIAFCMTLSDSEEIRQYLTAYLGSTPQVNAFAAEFLQRKGGNQKKNVEEWESTVTAKKGKKKKAGAH
jgi:GYF domain